ATQSQIRARYAQAQNQTRDSPWVPPPSENADPSELRINAAFSTGRSAQRRGVVHAVVEGLRFMALFRSTKKRQRFIVHVGETVQPHRAFAERRAAAQAFAVPDEMLAELAHGAAFIADKVHVLLQMASDHSHSFFR